MLHAAPSHFQNSPDTTDRPHLKFVFHDTSHDVLIAEGIAPIPDKS